MKHSEQLGDLATALAKAQGAMENASKDKMNPHFKSKYADLSAVWDAIREPLSTHGLSVVQLPSMDAEGRVNVCTMLLHSSGQYIEANYALPATKNDAQGFGSAITYMKRYALTGIGVAPEDDDGNGASRREDNDGNTTGGSTISAEQVQTIRDMIDRSGADLEKFCGYMKVPAIANIKSKDFRGAVEALNLKLHPKPVTTL